MPKLPTFKPLFTSEVLAKRVAEIGAAISKDHAAEGVVVICVLKGAVIFAADLIRTITCPVTLEFMACESYSGTTSTGTVRLTQDLAADIKGKQVILVEDIVDTGRTLDYLLRLLQQRRPASIKLCALLNKPTAREVEVPVHYQGFTIGDEFVVGYGLDLDQRHRELPYIAQITQT